jgi:hypothetical protein
LPLRLNSFFSSADAPATPTDPGVHSLTPAPITLTEDELDAIGNFLLESLWYSGANETWRFHRNGTVTFSDEPTEGTWTLHGRDAVVIRGEYEMFFRVDVNHDRLDGGIRWRGDPASTLNPFTLERGGT